MAAVYPSSETEGSGPPAATDDQQPLLLVTTVASSKDGQVASSLPAPSVSISFNSSASSASSSSSYIRLSPFFFVVGLLVVVAVSLLLGRYTAHVDLRGVLTYPPSTHSSSSPSSSSSYSPAAADEECDTASSSLSSFASSGVPLSVQAEYRQAAIAFATGYSVAAIHPFLATFRANHPRTQLILFVLLSKLTPLDLDVFCHYRVQLHAMDELVSLYPPIDPMVLRILVEADLLSGRYPFNDTTKVDAARQRGYQCKSSYFSSPLAPWNEYSYEVLQPILTQPLTHAFLCDTRDMVFQANIFRFLPYDGRFNTSFGASDSAASDSSHPVSISRGLFAFAESALIAAEPWNSLHVRCIQPDFPEAYPSALVLNGGQVLGSIDSLIVFLDSMVAGVARIPQCMNITGIDQPLYNTLVYRSELDTPVYVIPHDRGPVLALHTMKGPLPRNPTGQVLNELGEVYAVLHQVDRWSSVLFPRLYELYPILQPEHVWLIRSADSGAGDNDTATDAAPI